MKKNYWRQILEVNRGSIRIKQGSGCRELVKIVDGGKKNTRRAGFF
jgi:hypothetical protein